MRWNVESPGSICIGRQQCRCSPCGTLASRSHLASGPVPRRPRTSRYQAQHPAGHDTALAFFSRFLRVSDTPPALSSVTSAAFQTHSCPQRPCCFPRTPARSHWPWASSPLLYEGTTMGIIVRSSLDLQENTFFCPHDFLGSRRDVYFKLVGRPAASSYANVWKSA